MQEPLSEKNNGENSFPGELPLNEPIEPEPVNLDLWYLYSVNVLKNCQTEVIHILSPQLQSKAKLLEKVKAETDGLYICIKDIIPAKIVSPRLKIWEQLSDAQRELCEKATISHVFKKAIEAGAMTL